MKTHYTVALSILAGDKRALVRPSTRKCVLIKVQMQLVGAVRERSPLLGG